VLEGNYLVGAASLRIWERLAAAGNTFIASGPPAIEAVFTPDGKALTAADLAAANRVVTGKPTGRQVFVVPNRYEPGRAHVVVYNWDRAPEVEADLGGVLKAGARFRVQSAQDFFGKSVLEGTYDGKPLRLPMREYRAPPPVGKEGYLPPATGPEFNVFVVLPVE
jgi:hypothetical protein